MTLQFQTVAVIGAGTMGSGIAQVAAAVGCQVRLYDVKQEFVARGLAGITSFLDKGIERGKTTAEHKRSVLDHIQTDTDLTRAVTGANLVIEAVPEDLSLKCELFANVAKATGEKAVLATNTSSLSLARIFAKTPVPDRCCGMHFFNPPPLMPLLEVVRMSHTSQATLDRVVSFAKELGKEPILVKDSPGFASSRLGVALGLEAIRMVEEGVASPEDIDTAMRLGYAHPMGPLRLTDLVGLDIRMAIADYLRKELDNPVFEVPHLMRKMVGEGKLGKKTKQGFYRWD